ncbi:MAG: type II secretion system F family protein [Candidatus Saccharibacteria bacterium]|nr:type II secretion system F family protein [Candidatus Saccharibacteria bacterium]
MKRFAYKAKESSTGKVIKGTIQAETERVAGKLLVDRGYVPESLKEEGNGFGEKLNKVTTKDRINFTRQFATLVGAGLPIAQSLRTVSEQTSNKAMKSVIEEILADVESGRALGDAFGKHPDVFNNVYLSLIKAGEVSGTLDESLRRIATQEEKDDKMMGKIKSAMAMPLITLGVIIVVFIYMMLEVVPHVESLYNDLGEELPGLTLALVAIKDFIIAFWWLALIVIAFFVMGVMQFLKTEPGIRASATFKLNVPMFNGLLRMLYMARFARIAQILLSTGVAVLDTLEIAGNAANNVVVEDSVKAAAQEVQGGKTLSDALRDKPYIDPMVYQMAAIGEQSGKMDEMLGKAAQVFEDELDEKIATLSAMIEPVMMILLAIVAGLLVGGVLFPIYALVNSIG